MAVVKYNFNGYELFAEAAVKRVDGKVMDRVVLSSSKAELSFLAPSVFILATKERQYARVISTIVDYLKTVKKGMLSVTDYIAECQHSDIKAVSLQRVKELKKQWKAYNRELKKTHKFVEQSDIATSKSNWVDRMNALYAEFNDELSRLNIVEEEVTADDSITNAKGASGSNS